MYPSYNWRESNTNSKKKLVLLVGCTLTNTDSDFKILKKVNSLMCDCVFEYSSECLLAKSEFFLRIPFYATFGLWNKLTILRGVCVCVCVRMLFFHNSFGIHHV